MRSIHTIKSGNREKKDYYTKDESLKQSKDKDQKAYYGKGEGEVQGKTEAVWFGKDAARLNLRGHAEQADFEQIYDGFIPSTQDRIRGEKPREDHQENCLYDVVLSCKKSVSMQIHLGQDERLYKAYQETVLEIAQLVENDYAQARIQVNGDRRIVQTGGIIALMIPHHTSRELDMNVHTHLAIANGTYCEDGKWRSLLDRGFSHAYYMGDYFSARLAAKVQALGYEIRETVTEEGHPSWELAGYTDEQIKVFSKRSEDAKVKELVSAGMSRDDALMRTRKAKNAEETLEEAQGRWKVEADAFEIEAITPLDRPVEPKLRATPEQVLESAIRHYSNRSNHFTRDKIREYAFKLNRTFTVEDLDRVIAIHPELIDYGKLQGVDELKGHFTTAQAVEREIRTIKAWMQGKGIATAILGREAATQALEQTQLKTGQREAIIGVLASNNQHQIIHGLSGVGKTTALRQLKALTDRCSVEVMGFAPSIDAAKKLSGELGIETHTVQSLVKKNFDLKPNQILIIDEAGMVSAEMMDVVMQKANAAGARVLLVGDTGQNQAIEAGSPMRSLMQHGAEVHHIAEIIRQQNSIQRQAVELIAKGRGLDALSLLNEHDYINPIPDREYRVSALAAEFLSLSPEEQLNTLIVAGTNAEKDAITAQIRAGLKAEGRLGQSVRVVELQYAIPTPEEAQDISCYSVGDTVTLAMLHKNFSAQKSKLCFTVLAQKDDALVLRSTEGKIYQFNPALSILDTSIKVTQLRDRALTPEEARQIAYYRVGDYIKFTRNYKRISDRGYENTWLQKNVAYQVVGKENNELIVATAGGRRFRVNPSLMKDKQVFEGHEFDVAVGDSLRWTSSNRDKGQINGKTFKITAINGDMATVLTKDGSTQVDLSEALAVDYTLTSTSYRAQGSDRPRVFVSATNDPTSNREPFYVSISRQIKELKVWTDDYDGLKRRVAESNVQLNPLELLGEHYGSKSASANKSTAQSTHSPDSGATAAEHGSQSDGEQRLEHGTDRRQGRDGGLSGEVRGVTGEPEAIRDGGRDSGIDRDTQRLEGQTDELGTDPRRDDRSSELRRRRDQDLIPEAAQQSSHESSAELSSRIDRVISSLDRLADDDLVRDSGLVQSTREVVDALEPIVSALETQSAPVSPKLDLTAAMERAISALIQVDSEQVFSDNTIIDEIKGLAAQIEAHTLAQEQFINQTGEHHDPIDSHSPSARENGNTEQFGEHYVEQYSRSESQSVTTRRDSGVEPNGRDAGVKRHAANLEPTIRGSARAFVPKRNTGIKGHDPELAGHHRGAHQNSTQTSRNQERNVSGLEAEPGNRPGTAQDRPIEYRDIGSEPATATRERHSHATAGPNNETEQTGTIASGLFSRATDGLPALADAIVRIRLQRELKEPLAQLRSTLAELREVNQLNERLKAELDAQRSATVAHQVELVSERQSIAANKEALLAKLEAHLAQAKIEVLDTTLSEWRSLREEPESPQLPELAIAPSELLQLTSLLENYPAQKVIEYAMEEYYQASAQGISEFRNEPNEGTMSTKTVEPPKRKPQPAEPTTKPTKRQTSSKPIHKQEIAIFWEPNYSGAEQPFHINDMHWQDWVDSAVHPSVIESRLQSIKDQQVIERLLDKKLEFLGNFEKVKGEWKRRKIGSQHGNADIQKEIARYQPLAVSGGWWVDSGDDPRCFPMLKPSEKPQHSTYGTFKPDDPRIDLKKTLEKRKKDPNAPTQFRKYENPAGTKQELFERDLSFAHVPNEIAAKIFEKYGVVPTEEERRAGFWYTVWKHPEIPIYRVEGDKKDGALVSQGRVVISGQGVNAGYRANDQMDNPLPERVLHPQLAVFAVPGRQIRYAFDADQSVRSILNVRQSMVREGELLQARGCDLYVIKWEPSQGKGCDDLIKNFGPLAFENADRNAKPFEVEARIYYRTEFNAIARQVRTNYPQAKSEFLDAEVYLRTISKAEAKDGDRFLSQSDHARSLKTPEQVQAYVDHIKANAPQIRQQYQDALAAKAVAEAQQQKELAATQAMEQAKALAQQQPVIDRANYEKLAQQVRNQLYNIPPKQFDAFVYKWAQAKGLDGDRIVAQSDISSTFKSPREVSGYVKRMKQLANRIAEAPGADVSDQQRQLNVRAVKSCEWLAVNYGKQQADGWMVFEGNQFSCCAKEGEYKIYSRVKQRNVLVFGNNRLDGALSLREVEKFESAVEKGKTMAAEKRQAKVIKKSREKGR
jgi:conjugative relaxase-like TrwC/TraI family protein